MGNFVTKYTAVCKPMPELRIDTPAEVVWEQWPNELAPPVMAVFRYSIQAADQPLLYSMLLPNEQQRAGKFGQLADRQRFVAGRGWLRWLAGQLTATPPGLVQLAAGLFGKPELINPETNAATWHVNVSHAGEWVLVAIGSGPVGVDVEWISPDWPYQELIPSSFNADDQAYLAASADARALFYTFWTRKESLLKATGQGLTNDLRRISSSKGVHQVVDEALAEVSTWRAMSFSVAAGYVGAVACQEPALPVRFFTLDTVTVYSRTC